MTGFLAMLAVCIVFGFGVWVGLSWPASIPRRRRAPVGPRVEALDRAALAVGQEAYRIAALGERGMAERLWSERDMLCARADILRRYPDLPPDGAS